MAISISFSAFIYRIVSYEFQRRVDEIERRLELRRFGFLPPPGETQLFIADVKEAQAKVLYVLIYTNAVILIFSSAAGYFLAGMTLRPIEEAMDEQKRFVADASHELKTPLTSLQTSIEVALRDKEITLKEALFTLSDSLSDIKNMTNLTSDLLSLTKYQQNGREFFGKVNLQDVIQSSIKKVSPLAKKKKIGIKIISKDSEIRGNKEGLEKLITILLDNAVKYTPEKGGIEVNSRKTGKYVTISVSDTGCGITKKDMPMIFERFYRSDISRSKIDASGFGLGLSIAKSIADIHKGTITVESQLGKGSTFIVKLPSD
ncbi:MAG: Two-component system, sensor protein, histidineprotein kinase [Candidatus Woesebacteria bacterium GW2011_GWB1_38_5]|uniref:histidine kinase n=4 Tax=Candidatus Woeseibacteriota TaxID=1752722 RepID=A0A0G0NAR9_9BACT|nr:MAG: Two-component system, sensor protein, histidineprotein kinase [Candidatus Woesebacteria bacterium GW2011_GWD1_38_10]KKQ55827.1 MAG: Two-component system, sensor protein, histidineprotein kinase [Candidatus Woesebacteria bacterium GW2011_GWC1_38_13]KKQ74191.1 MAG: Two-component system, sensor protein, histidineprotein kinase [Candidatus Woesebacteria bacterium GW2011_GWB1_38_5]KKQ83235.1 MAG: Two-component system, sensor protein, histidineprotein kinase [Candidatus Woesebacteria bacterium